MALTPDSGFDQVANHIIAETKARGYTRAESVAALSTAIQESGLNPRAVSPNGKWRGIYQQDSGYPGRDDPNLNIKAFLDRLDVKRASAGASDDPFKNIFWLQQRPSEKSADEAFDDPQARKAYYAEIKKHIAVAERAYDAVKADPPPAPPNTPVGYGLPRGSNSGGYGGGGVRFPDWVYALGNAFGVKPSTYPGHQESDRVEAGYARNPNRLNRGIDWAAPGAPDQVERMQRFADYIFSVRGEVEQLIWEHPVSGRRLGVAGGKDVTASPYFDYNGGYNDHRDHVHTRQSHAIPLPGNAPVPAPIPPPPMMRPQFEERQMFGNGAGRRSRPPINFFIHTEEGNGSAKSLAEYCQGQNGVSYHYTLRDRIVYDVVDTDLYSWSVLDANVFSINLCFAGSKASFTREQWLQREGDIEVAAYLAVQDARKYGFSTEVLPPPYNGNPRSGISDHNYVTRELGIGTHTDVGPNFPWDVFTRYVNTYANTTTPGHPPTQGDDELTPEQDQMLRAIFKEQTQRHDSRSQVREPNEGEVDTWAGMDLNTDGNVDLVATFVRGLAKYPDAISRLERVAAGGEPGRSPKDALLAQALHATLGDFWRLLATPTQTVVVAAPAAAPKPTLPQPTMSIGVDTTAMQRQLAVAGDEIVRLQAENAELKRQLAAAEYDRNAVRQGVAAAAAPPLPITDSLPEYQDTTGDHAARVIDSVESWTAASVQLDAKQRSALNASLEVLALGPQEDNPVVEDDVTDVNVTVTKEPESQP